MNNHCWRNTSPKVNDEDERTWPKLPHPAVQERSQIKSIQRSRISRLPQDLASGSEMDNLHETLNEVDYPKLGEIVLKRKHSFVESNQVAIYDKSANPEPRRLRVLKSTDLIHINLQKTLETQRWPLLLQAEQATKITVDICKLNVNMNVANLLDGRTMLSKSKRSITHIGKKKKPSRLKWLILYARMMRREIDASRRQICEIEEANGDIPEINFDRLKINVAPRDDPELVKKMAALSCLNTNYRNTSQVNISEDTVIFRPDVHEKMDNLSLGDVDDCRLDANGGKNDSNVCNAEDIDCDVMEATLSLKVCDETGEFTDNICIKQEPGRIQLSKKFREYCTNTVTPDLKKHLEEFLAEISRLQKRMYERDNVKGKSKRRHYAGIKEVQKHIELKKIKFVVIAPDLEKVEMEGGLDDTISKLIGTCKRYEVPYCFGLGRRKLGYFTHGKGFVSCIGIANYSGAEEKLKNVLFDVVEARNEYARLVSDEARTIDVDKLLPKEELILSEIINAYLKILASSS